MSGSASWLRFFSDPEEFEVVRERVSADFGFPTLAPGEHCVLKADFSMYGYVNYIDVTSQEEARAAIEETMAAAEQTFMVVRPKDGVVERLRETWPNPAVRGGTR